jgi:hypothetical protein
MTLVKIANGKVDLPMLKMTETGFTGYTGNDTLIVSVMILDSQTMSSDSEEDPLGGVMFSSVTFANGGATKAWNDGITGW